MAGSIWWYAWASGRVAAAREWPQAHGKVASARVEESRSETRERDSSGRERLRVSHSYSPRITYTYRVGGRVYRSDTIWLTSAPSWSEPAEAEACLADYRVGSEVELFYNPADPSDSALILEPPTPMIFLATAMGLGWLAAAWVFGPDTPRPVGPPGLARQLLRNRRRR